MALPPTEIRYSRNVLYRTIVFCIIGTVFMTCALFFSPSSQPNTGVYIGYAFCVLAIGFIIRWLARMIRDNRPVLTFHSSGLEVHRRKPVFIQWATVASWKIRRSKSDRYLDIRTLNGKESIRLSNLDSSPKRLEELVAQYVREPGPGGLQRQCEPVGKGVWQVRQVK